MVQKGSSAAAECWFLDVGQGNANVILLGGGRAIVVDSGPKGSAVALKLLQRYVHTIEALIVSHNDADHDGGTARILAAFPKPVKQVYYLTDRPARLIRTYCAVKREREAGNLLHDPQRIEAKDVPQKLYEDKDQQIEVLAIYPTFLESQDAEAAGTGRPNNSSAIICLRCGGRRVVFPGDASLDAWRSVASRLGRAAPLSCDILAVPHHGGAICSKAVGESDVCFEARHAKELRALYTQFVQPSIGVVSVGSSNRFGNVIHPHPTVIRTLCGLGVRVMCTQITPHCCEDLEAIRPGVLEPRWPSRSCAQSRKTGSGRSKDVACFGSIVAEVSPGAIAMSIVDEHAHALSVAMGERQVAPLCVD